MDLKFLINNCSIVLEFLLPPLMKYPIKADLPQWSAVCVCMYVIQLMQKIKAL